MIEIIPNWHPIFVHFTLALFTMSVGFYGLAYITSRFNIVSKPLVNEFEIAARWCLWSAALITLITVLAGWYAFDTVNHDEISHEAMHTHKNWALSTATMILLVAVWSLFQHLKQKKEPTLIFLIILLVIQLYLLSTAWHGSELVYRYGLGVMSLPAPEVPGHHPHQHAGETQPSNEPPDHTEEHHHHSNE